MDDALVESLPSRAEYVVLATLRVSGPPYRLFPTELGRTLLQTSAGITNTVDRLEHARLVTRVSAPRDRRSILVGLTATGVKMAERLFAAEMAAQQAVLAGMSAAERRRAVAVLRRLNLRFDALPSPTAETPPRRRPRRSAVADPVGRGKV
ncbi:MAG: MarR family transcriptional regulator protein [Deltaproteobacteria bacterium]|nr:MarR family transcriptional regulator protein [Deltaproteobacteria bacterium]